MQYTSFEKALADAEDGDTIKLLTDVKVALPNNSGYAYPAVYSIGKSITIDGDNHTFRIDTANWSKYNDQPTGYFFTVGIEDAYIVPGTNNDVDVTMKNMTLIGDADYVRAAINAYAPRTLPDGTTADTKLTLENVNIEGFGTYSLGVNNSDVTVEDCDIDNGGWGYAIDVSKATASLTVESGNIGVISFVDHDSNVQQTGTINGGHIEDVLVEDEDADVQISGGTFDNDVSDYLADGFTLESYVDENGNTVYGVTPVYTVTFDSNGGSAVDAQVIKVGEKAVKPADPNRKGYLFQGWYLNNKPFNFNTAITEDITLTARWGLIYEPSNLPPRTRSTPSPMWLPPTTSMTQFCGPWKWVLPTVPTKTPSAPMPPAPEHRL